MNTGRLRILYMANAPHVPTGYGVQSKSLLPALRAMPEVDEIIIVAFYGVQGGRIKYRMGGSDYQIVPTYLNDWGNDSIANYALEFEADIVISLLDIWPLDEMFGKGFRWLPYAPIDIDPIPEAFTSRLQHAYLPIVYSQHAASELEKLGIEHAYAPHGVNTKVFRPMHQMTRRWRAGFDWPEAAQTGYVFGMVSANKGNPPRKAFPEVFDAFSRLLAEHDDIWLYLHTLGTEEFGGIDMLRAAKTYGISDRLILPNKHLYISGAYDDDDMARLYNCFDCLLGPSYSEGFGIPLIEAQSCGVPVVVTDAFAMSELCGAGWKIPWNHRLYTPIGGHYVMPDVDALTDAMWEAKETGRKPLAAQARAFALDYDWDHIVKTYWHPLIQRLQRELSPRTYRYADAHSTIGTAPVGDGRGLAPLAVSLSSTFEKAHTTNGNKQAQSGEPTARDELKVDAVVA